MYHKVILTHAINLLTKTGFSKIIAVISRLPSSFVIGFTINDMFFLTLHHKDIFKIYTHKYFNSYNLIR